MTRLSAPRLDLPQALLGLLTSPSSFNEGLVLLEHLVARGDIGTGTSVNMNRSKDHRSGDLGSMPLLTAIALAHSAGHYNPAFYRKETADRLHSIDPRALASRTATGAWWIWENLQGWRNQSERERSGFGPAADAWAAAVIEKLPDQAFAGQDAQSAWQDILKMGLAAAAVAFAARVPGQWLARDQKKLLVLKTARSAEMWSAALRQGVDPFASSWAADGTHQPLWRDLLPRSSSAAPEAGSLRAGVEEWLTEQIAAGHPQAETMLAYKAAWLTRWLGRDGEYSKTETDREWAARLAIVSQQPSQWLEVKKPDAAWLKPFFNRTPGRAKRWAQAIAQAPEWRRRVGPLNDLVLALFENPNLDHVPGEVWESLAHKTHADIRSQLEALLDGQVWGKNGPNPARSLAAFDAHRLSAVLAVPTTAHPKPRM